MTKIPRQYQLEAVERAATSNLLLCDDCGLGKTLQAVLTGLQSNLPVLVICPKTVRAQWLAEIADQDRPALQLEYDFDFVKPFTSKGSYFVVTHYEAAVKHIDWLRRTLWGLLVIDEAHKIKTRAKQNKKVKRTQAIKSLVALRKLALTGTPFNRDVTEYWSLLNFLEPRIYTSYWKWRDQYFEDKKDFLGYTLSTEIRDPVAFAEMLSKHVLRRTKAQVAPELPAKIIQIVPIELAPDQRALYKQIEDIDDLTTEILNTTTGELTRLLVTIVLTKILRLQQAASNPALIGSNAVSAKLEWLRDWLDANPDQSVIVFTKFKDTAMTLWYSNLFQALITGDTKKGDPYKADHIVSTVAMGVGLDLPHISTAIFLDSDWSSIQMRQAVDRIDRLGITESKHIIYLDALETVDQLIRSVLDNNESQNQLVDRFLLARKTA